MAIVAPTAMKGTMTPAVVARALARGVARALAGARVVEVPLSDGGNGLLESFRHARGGELSELEVSGPLGVPVRARLLRSGGSVVVEAAEACGLHLMAERERDPLRASTRGVGELLRRVEVSTDDRIVLGLGGSGTVDGGTGMARALGWRFEDASGRPLSEGGGALVDLARIVSPPRAYAHPVLALCDVWNPLVGPQGAAAVYAPQKGASAEDVAVLETGLQRLARLVSRQLGIEIDETPGGGAAGGLAAGARAFLDARLVSGARWMIELTGLPSTLRRAAVLVTAEGRFDAQSSMGKVTGELIRMARESGVPVLLVCGRVEGAPPEGVVVREGGEGHLTEDDLERLALAGCRELAAGDRL